jgi:hypothetical protein
MCANGISRETASTPVNVLSATFNVLRSLPNRKRIFSPSWENAKSKERPETAKH